MLAFFVTQFCKEMFSNGLIMSIMDNVECLVTSNDELKRLTVDHTFVGVKKI